MNQKSDFKIEDTLKGLEILYEKHIESFQPGLMPDLEKQSQAREKLFDSLIENKDDMNNISCKKEISNILHSNQILLQLAEQKRNELAENMKNTSKGKKALAGYGQLDRRSKTPRVMSFKG